MARARPVLSRALRGDARDAQPTGTYTGAPAAFELRPLLERAEREHRRLVVVDVLKDMPGFGSTAQLVPRQLAREDLRGEVIGEVPGARLLQVAARPRSTPLALAGAADWIALRVRASICLSQAASPSGGRR